MKIKDRRTFVSLRTLITTATACGLVGITAAHAEPLTPAAIEKIVRTTVGFEGNRQVTVAASGNEVDINTYTLSAGAPDNDLKIEALSVSKSIIDKQPTITRVRVRFYEPASQTDYREVVATITDIKAFISGAVTKSQLLSALVVERHQSSRISAISSVAKPTSGATPATYSASGSAGTVVRVGARRFSFTGQGLSFTFPANWLVDPTPQHDYFITLRNPFGSYFSIKLSTHNKPITEWVASEDAEHSARPDLKPLAVAQQLRVGVGGRIFAYNRTYSHTDGGGKVSYQQYVYFGAPTRRYKIKLVTTEKNYQHATNVLQQTLNSMQYIN